MSISLCKIIVLALLLLQFNFFFQRFDFTFVNHFSQGLRGRQPQQQPQHPQQQHNQLRRFGRYYTQKFSSMMEKKLFLVLSVHYCQADPILKVAPFQINRTRFSPPTITQKGDEELSTKKTYRY